MYFPRMFLTACLGLSMALAFPAAARAEDENGEIDDSPPVIFAYEAPDDLDENINGTTVHLSEDSGGNAKGKVPVTGLWIRGTADAGGVLRVGKRGVLINEAAAPDPVDPVDPVDPSTTRSMTRSTSAGIKIDKYGMLQFDEDSYYSGGGDIFVGGAYLGDTEGMTDAERPKLVVRSNVGLYSKTDVPDSDPIESYEADKGLAQLFADTTLGTGGLVRIGGADFVGDLILNENSVGGRMDIDDASSFSGVLNLYGSDLRVTPGLNDKGAAKAVTFGGNVSANSIRMEQANVYLGNNTTMTATGGSVSVGNQANLWVNGSSGANIVGNTKFENGSSLNVGTGALNIVGNTTFEGGSTLNMDTGSVTVEGDVLFQSGSTYNATLGAMKSSVLSAIASTTGGEATGSVTIEDNVNLIVGGLKPSQTGVKTVIAAEGGITGSFTSKIYDFTTSADGKSLEIAKVKNAQDIVDGSVARNRGIAGSMELFDRVVNDASDTSGLSTQLASRMEDIVNNTAYTDVQRTEATNQLLGEYATRYASLSRENARQFNTGIGRRITAVHDAAGSAATQVGSGAAAGSVDLYYPEPIVLSSSEGYPSAMFGGACAPEEKARRFWVGGYGGWSNQKDRDDQRGYKYDSTGLIMGYDWQRGDWTLGVSGAVGSGSLKNNEGLSKTDVDVLNVGVYASYDPVTGLFADANIGYGHSWNKARTEMITGGEKTGKFRDNSLSAGLNVGYVLSWDDLLRITPTFGVQWTRTRQGGWTENVTGSDDMAFWFGKNDTDYVELPLAVRVSRAIQLSSGAIITPEARLAYVYEAGDTAPTVRLGYVGSGDSALVHGIDGGSGRTVVGGGVKANINANVDAFFDYNMEFRKGYHNNSLTTGVGITF